MDMVVSRVRVLQENFIETAPAAPWEMLLGSGVQGPPSIRPKGVVVPDVAEEVVIGEGDAEVDFMDQIYDRKESNRDVEAEGEGLGAGGGAGGGGAGGGDSMNNAQSVGDSTGSDVDVLPVLTLSTINLFGHNAPHTYTSSPPTRGGVLPVSAPMQVTVVDNYSKIQQFAAAVRQLSHTASSSIGRSSKG